MNHDTWGRGGGRVCSNNPDHKVGMLAQRILKMPSSISLGVLELQSPNILTYLMNVSCMCHKVPSWGAIWGANSPLRVTV